MFPGPTIECETNDNVIVEVINKLDEPFLITWCVVHVLPLFQFIVLIKHISGNFEMGQQEWGRTKKDFMARWSARN